MGVLTSVPGGKRGRSARSLVRYEAPGKNEMYEDRDAPPVVDDDDDDDDAVTAVDVLVAAGTTHKMAEP